MSGCSAWLRAVVGSVLATALCVSGADTAVNKAAAKPASRSAAAKPAEKPVGYNVAPAPSWVQAVSLEGLPAIPDAPLQLLLMDDQTRLDPAGSQRFSHIIRKINTSAGLEQGSQIEIVFDPSYQKLTLHGIAIWRDGKRLDRLDKKSVKLLQRETQLERQMVDGRTTASVVLEDLRAGDRVEWSYTITGDNPVFEGKFVDTQWMSSSRGPVALVQRRLLTPMTPVPRTIHHQVTGPSESKEQLIEGGAWREIIVSRRAAPQFHFDGQMPMEDYFTDLLEWSEFADWKEISAWAARQFAPALQEHEAMAAKAEEIRAATADPAERMTMAVDFVQQQIRYFGTEIGASSHRPALPSLVLKQRFGDCKDKSAMVANLLGQLGFEATPAVVSTIYRTQIAKHLPSPLAFDHAIVAVRQGDRWLWLDGTRSMQKGPALKRGIAGLSPALLARNGETALTPLPAARDQLQAESVDTFHFTHIAEGADLVSVTTYYGDMAESLRSARANVPTQAFEEMATGELMRAYPKLQRQGELLIEEVEGQNAVRATVKARAPDLWRLFERRQLVADVVLFTPVSALRVASSAPRQLATGLSLPGRYRHKLRFAFDEDVFTQSSESPIAESNAFFDLKGQGRTETRATQLEVELRLNAQRVESAQWSAYVETLNKVWPRISSQVVLSTVSPERGLLLKKNAEEMKDALIKGRVKAQTSAQVDARYGLLVVEQQLASGRLAPKLKAEVLVRRGELQDHLALNELARASFEQAATLDPQSSGAQAGLAINALLRGDDASAQAAAERALELSPSSNGPRYTRAQARYMAGDYAGAASEFTDMLDSGNEVQRSYQALWLFLTKRAQGQDATAAVAAIQPLGDNKPAWPYAVLRMVRGDLSFDAALAEARADPAERRNRECELYFFAAEQALLDKNPDQARRWFERSMETGVVEYVEYALARREKARLGS